jgi:hypothetical protein
MTLDIQALRLLNQRISQPSFKEPGDVVAWLGVMQAQDYTGAKWSVGLRMESATEAGIEQAIEDKCILRTWVLRGTLHFVTPADIHWMVALVAPQLVKGRARRYQELELDEPTMTRSNDLLINALRDGERQSRKALFALLEENGISTKGQRGVHMLQRASMDGLICQGTAPKNDPIFMCLDEVVPNPKTLPREEALAELARRYFTSHGPTTLQDFVAWSGLLISEARAGLEAIKSELSEEKLGEQTYWWSADTQPKSTKGSYLLPGFDEYMLGYRDRNAFLDPQYATKVVPGGNGVFYPTLVLEGQIVGTWKRTVKKGEVTITPSPFTELSAAELDTFAPAAEHYSRFLEMPISLA